MARRSLHDEGSQHPDGAAQAQGRARFRHGAAAVHAGHGVALEGVRGRAMPASATQPLAVLFACGLNSVRSPIAAGAVCADVRPRASMSAPPACAKASSIRSRSPSWRRSASISRGTSRSPSRSSTSWRVSISTSSSRSRRRPITGRSSSPAPARVDVEYWPTVDPTDVEGSREQRLDAYREVRDQLLERASASAFAGQRSGQ